MQVVNVLGDDKDRAGVLVRQAGERVVGGVRLDSGITQLDPPGVVEGLHARRVTGEGFRRGHVFDPSSNARGIAALGPNAVRVAEGGEAALAADTRAREDDDPALIHRGGVVERRQGAACAATPFCAMAEIRPPCIVPTTFRPCRMTSRSRHVSSSGQVVATSAWPSTPTAKERISSP